MKRLSIFGLAVLIGCTGGEAAQTDGAAGRAAGDMANELGVIHFPTSGAPEAQEHFLRGAALLHSFGFEDAAEEFKRAQEIDPDFAMAYWGEALSYNHPLNRMQELDLPRQALAKLGPDRAARVAKAPTDREKGFVEAVDILFAEGPEDQRRVAHAQAMERLAERYPDDQEVQAFFALALLGAAGDIGHEAYRTHVKAGAIALKIFEDNPSHPGAPHFIIHAFDDPIHAPLALEAAQRFAEIAPAVVHALHMPSHIFIQLGMWDDVSRSNDASFAAAMDLWEIRHQFSETTQYFNSRNLAHALDWGQYGDLQRGAYEKAWQGVEYGRMISPLTDEPLTLSRNALLFPRYVIETEEWQEVPITEASEFEAQLAAGISAVRRGDLDAADRAEVRLAQLARNSRAARVAHHEVQGLLRIARGDVDAGLRLLEEATRIEESDGVPRGAPSPVKPSHELLGEALLELERPAEAADWFARSLLRTPNRTLSLRGMARASMRSGDEAAARHHYQKILDQWRGDMAHPTVLEARSYTGEG